MEHELEVRQLLCEGLELVVHSLVQFTDQSQERGSFLIEQRQNVFLVLDPVVLLYESWYGVDRSTFFSNVFPKSESSCTKME